MVGHRLEAKESVSDTRNEQISIVDNARDRLARAVARAEAIARHVADNKAAAAKATASADDLQSALEAARAENEALRARNVAVSKKLDAAIGQLKSMLAGSA
jgi:hypothetical protein